MKWSLVKKFTIFIIAFLLIFPIIGSIITLRFLESKNLNFADITKTSGNIYSLDPSLIPDFNFTDLDETWYDHNIEMIIITPPDKPGFKTVADDIAFWKNEKGVRTIVLDNYTSYPGRDGPEQIRNMIKDFYEREGIRWVLLAGDAEDGLIPIRYVYNPDAKELEGKVPPESVGDDYLKPTDFYYADLTGTWDDNNNNIFGESAIYNAQGIDEIDWTPEVYVGRFPASTATELGEMVNKTIKYESDPAVGDWMNRMLLAGGISDTIDEDSNGEDESRLTEYIYKNYVESEMAFTHLYRTTYFPVNTTYTSPDYIGLLTLNNFDTQFNLGYSTVMFAGHGSPQSYTSKWETGTSQFTVYNDNDASTCLNTNNLSLIYADACTTSSFDTSDGSIGEILIKKINTGAIGYVGALRVTWYSVDDEIFELLNRANAKLFWEEFFENNIYQQGKTLYDSKVAYMNSELFLTGFTSMHAEYQRKNVLTYCLLGDPDVDIYTNIPLSASNPFTGDIYEGQLVSITITDNQSQIVPFARVHLTTDDSKYSTVYADANGVAQFRVYPTANETYNVTITGHNLVPSHFNFTTKEDDIKPVISSTYCNEITPTTLDNICFDIFASDNRSGIESAILLIQDKASGTYTHQLSRNTLYENDTALQILLNKMVPGQYEFIIITRDYANNTQFYSQTYEFLIPIPLSSYILIGGIVLIILFVGLSVIGIYKGNKKHSIILKRLK